MQTSNKPVVTYQQAFGLKVGSSAYIKGVKGHPSTDRVSHNANVRTSTVLSVGENGSFETLNTKYVLENPAPRPAESPQSS